MPVLIFIGVYMSYRCDRWEKKQETRQNLSVEEQVNFCFKKDTFHFKEAANLLQKPNVTHFLYLLYKKIAKKIDYSGGAFHVFREVVLTSHAHKQLADEYFSMHIPKKSVFHDMQHFMEVTRDIVASHEDMDVRALYNIGYVCLKFPFDLPVVAELEHLLLKKLCATATQYDKSMSMALRLALKYDHEEVLQKLIQMWVHTPMAEKKNQMNVLHALSLLPEEYMSDELIKQMSRIVQDLIKNEEALVCLDNIRVQAIYGMCKRFNVPLPKKLDEMHKYMYDHKQPHGVKHDFVDKLRRKFPEVSIEANKDFLGYGMDLYIPEVSLNIEIDGIMHHFTRVKDRIRDLLFLEKGVGVCRIDSHDIIANSKAEYETLLCKRIAENIRQILAFQN